jgi:hypothetical protein
MYVQMGLWLVHLRESGQLEDLGVDGRVILKWIFKTWVRGHGRD